MGPRRALALAVGLALAVVGAAPATSSPVAVEVQTEPGKAGLAAQALRTAGHGIDRRDGASLQVAVEPTEIAGLQELPGVAAAGTAPTAFGDAITSIGLQRSGAAAFAPISGGGSGLIIAVLDLGFGPHIATRQAERELPPPPRLVQVSFDPINGLAGRNAYGNATNHGELVAQTVYDYAPKARYVFANYRTRQDFVRAVDWLAQVRPNIVVHSNSFLEGPFDGTGPEAQAVDRAAAAGILWFNSAGNYAQRHWEGPWVDVDADGALDLGIDNEWTFERELGMPTTFTLSWESPASATSDLALALERKESDGSWSQVTAADDDQTAGARESERFVGYRDGKGGTFRARVTRSSGPPPKAITIFSREIDLEGAGGSEDSSQPGPGDAAGAISVGAVDWRGDGRKTYSSVGPTDDGRRKPDLVAPTNTRVQGRSGARRVGGTSNAAPNAAGAAAVLMGTLRKAGLDFSAAAVRERLFQRPFDLGDPGFDFRFGAGRVRIEHDAPVLRPERPAPFAFVRGRMRASVAPLDASRLANWQLSVDGLPVTPLRRTEHIGPLLDTRRLSDGWHRLRVVAQDWPGNAGVGEWWVRVDNTAPRLVVRRTKIAARQRPVLPQGIELQERTRRVRTARRAPRAVRMRILARDNFGGRLRVGVRILDRRGKRLGSRSIGVKPGAGRWISVGKLRRGRYRVQLLMRDVAGNTTRAGKRILVR
ncbi:MAG: S8 family serine peptidase [Thermoleophilia bacterium]|nr:S8 family serine peptidase [Thermoleophilia bacterium]